MTKKNNLIIVIVIIIILAIIGTIIVKNSKKKIQNENEPLSQSNLVTNQDIIIDTTKSIANNINSINIVDTSDRELGPVDKELLKL